MSVQLFWTPGQNERAKNYVCAPCMQGCVSFTRADIPGRNSAETEDNVALKHFHCGGFYRHAASNESLLSPFVPVVKQTQTSVFTLKDRGSTNSTCFADARQIWQHNI